MISKQTNGLLWIIIISLLTVAPIPNAKAQWQRIALAIKSVEQLAGHVNQLDRGMEIYYRAAKAGADERDSSLNPYLAAIEKELEILNSSYLQDSPDMSGYLISVDDVNSPDDRCQAYGLAQDAVDYLQDGSDKEDLFWKLVDVEERLKRAEESRGQFSRKLDSDDFELFKGLPVYGGLVLEFDGRGPIANTLSQAIDTVRTHLNAAERSLAEFNNPELINSYKKLQALAEKVAIDQGFESPCGEKIMADDIREMNIDDIVNEASANYQQGLDDVMATEGKYRESLATSGESTQQISDISDDARSTIKSASSAGESSNSLGSIMQTYQEQSENYGRQSQEGSRSTYNESSDSGQYGNPPCPSSARYIVGRLDDALRDMQEMLERNDRVCGTCAGPDGSVGYYCE